MFPAAFVGLALYSLVLPVAEAHFQRGPRSPPPSPENPSLKQKRPPFLSRILGNPEGKKQDRRANVIPPKPEKVVRVQHTPTEAKHYGTPVIATTEKCFWTGRKKDSPGSVRTSKSGEDVIRDIASEFATRGTTLDTIKELEEHVAQRRAARVSQTLNDAIENCPECQARRRRYYAGYTTGLPDEEIPSDRGEQTVASESPVEEEPPESSAHGHPEQEAAQPRESPSTGETPEERRRPEPEKEYEPLPPGLSPDEVPEQDREEIETPKSTEKVAPAGSQRTREEAVQEPADLEPEEVAGPEGREAPQEGEPQREAANQPAEEPKERHEEAPPTPALRRPKGTRPTVDEKKEGEHYHHEEEAEEAVTPDLTPAEKADLEAKVTAGEGFSNKPWLWFYTLAVFPLLTFLILISLAFFT